MNFPKPNWWWLLVLLGTAGGIAAVKIGIAFYEDPEWFVRLFTEVLTKPNLELYERRMDKLDFLWDKHETEIGVQ
jgi:hypothetical protein